MQIKAVGTFLAIPVLPVSSIILLFFSKYFFGSPLVADFNKEKFNKKA